MNGNTILYLLSLMMAFFQFDFSKKESAVTQETDVQYHVPEVYELMNIALSLTKVAQEDPYMIHRKTAYYKAVKKYFGKYSQHKLIQKLEKKLHKNPTDRYYNFRENSYLYCFNGDALVNCKKLDYVFGNKLNNQTKKIKLLLEDFAKFSDFKKFYKQHQKYYDTICHNAKNAALIGEMKTWLEKRFPQVKKSAVELVLSPLIKNNHSTFNVKKEKRYIIFLNPPHYKFPPNDPIKNIYYTGSIFTEIDNHYAAATSHKFKKQIKALKLKKWTLEGKPSSFYKSSQAIFEEYLTHALFLLYLEDKYDPASCKSVKTKWIKFMNKRGFLHFEAYFKKLLELYRTKSTVIESLYPELIKWIKQKLKEG